jgi:hypothetical protein
VKEKCGSVGDKGIAAPVTELPVQDGPLIELLTVKRMIIARFEDFWPSTA